MDKTKKDIFISPAPAVAKTTALSPTVWVSANFSHKWFEDALHEATTENTENSMRREIIFSVCFLESYIFEWVRNIDIGIINNYFPAQSRYQGDTRYRRTLKNKWKGIPKELFGEGKLTCEPSLNLSELGILIKYRDGLVHAAASRPSTDVQAPNEKPVPPIDELKKLSSGWALSIAVELVKKLHNDLGTDPPDYFENWKK